MRTVCGLARQAQRWLCRAAPARPVTLVPPGRWTLTPAGPATPAPAGPSTAAVPPPADPGPRLLTERLGEQRRGGARLDQVDPTTCGSAVLVAMAAWADPAELERLDGQGGSGTDGPGAGLGAADRPGAGAGAGAGVGVAGGPAAGAATGFGDRYDTRQRQVHAQTNRLWPQALGTTPWAMARWLRRHAPAAGPYRVRLVDDSADDVDDALAAVAAALAAGRPVPLLVGSLLPRHWVLALGPDERGWRVYEPTSGSVRAPDLDLVRCRRLGPVLGFDRLHAVLLPVRGSRREAVPRVRGGETRSSDPRRLEG